MASEEISILLWINDLKAFGKKSYVFLDIEKMTILSMNEDAVRDPIASTFLLDGIISGGGHVGEFFAQIIPSEDPVFSTLETMTAIAENSTAMNIILVSNTAMNFIQTSNTAMTTIISSNTAMNIIVTSNIIMNTIAASSAFMAIIAASSMAMNIMASNIISVTAIEASTIAKTALYNSSLKQSIDLTANQAWTNRRTGKVWFISQKQSYNNSTSLTYRVRYTIKDNDTISNTGVQTYNVNYRIDRFMTGIINYWSGTGDITMTYYFIPCE